MVWSTQSRSCGSTRLLPTDRPADMVCCPFISYADLRGQASARGLKGQLPRLIELQSYPSIGEYILFEYKWML